MINNIFEKINTSYILERISSIDINDIVINVVFMVLGVTSRFILIYLLEKIKIKFNYNERKIIKSLSKQERDFIKNISNSDINNHILVDNLIELGIIERSYENTNICDAFGEKLLTVLNKDKPIIYLTPMGEIILKLLNKEKKQ